MTFFHKLKKFTLNSIVYFSLAITLALAGNVSAMTASFDFNPANRQLINSCRQSINIDIDPASASSNAADIEVAFNPNEITILDSNSNIPGVQIKSGNAYETYFGNIVDQTGGKILLAGASFVGNVTSRKTFATIEFSNKPNINTASFTIKFDGGGATLDSNIAEANTSDDLLTSVTNGSYTFVAGNCEQDRIPPVINFVSPTNYATGVPVQSPVEINITDNLSGVDINSVKFTINDQVYLASDPEVSRTGTNLNYTFTIIPRVPFYSDKASIIVVEARDLAGNRATGQIIFNIPPAVIAEVLCPTVPNTGGTGGTGGNNNSGGGNQNPTYIVPLPRTGGVDTEEYVEVISQQAKEQSKNQFWHDFSLKPIVDLYFAKDWQASLKLLELFATINTIFAVLVIYLSWYLNKRAIVKDIAFAEKNKQPLAQREVYIQNLHSGKEILLSTASNTGEYSFSSVAGVYQSCIFKKDKKNAEPEFTNVFIIDFDGKAISQKDLFATNAKITPFDISKSNTAKSLLDSVYKMLFGAGLMISLIAFLLTASGLQALILAVYVLILLNVWKNSQIIAV